MDVVPGSIGETHTSGISSFDPGLKGGEGLEHQVSHARAIRVPQSSLMLHMVTILPNGLKIPLRVLVDTGCEMCLIRSGLFSLNSLLLPEKVYPWLQPMVRLLSVDKKSAS